MDAFPPPPPLAPPPTGGMSSDSQPNNNNAKPRNLPRSTSFPTTAATAPPFAPSITPTDPSFSIQQRRLSEDGLLMTSPNRPAPFSASILSSLSKEQTRPTKGRTYSAILPPSPSFDDTLPFVPRDLDRFPRQKPVPRLSIDSSSSVSDALSEVDYGYSLANGSPLHNRLASEPLIPLLRSTFQAHSRASSMALYPPSDRPPPLQIDPSSMAMSRGFIDSKPLKTPGNKISSFFGWKGAYSPGTESIGTEVSDASRSPISPRNGALGKVTLPAPVDVSKANGYFQPTRSQPLLANDTAPQIQSSKLIELESELREISSELAGSIRREMELEDLVEKLQSEVAIMEPNRRTSDYFSDSGISSTKNVNDSEKHMEDIEKIRRAAEQERALLKVGLSQRWQEERSQRTASESHILFLEKQVQQLRQEIASLSELAMKNRELEIAFEDTRRKLMEERRMKDNFEDLLAAMRVELEQVQHGHRNGVSDETEIERLVGEIEALKIENAALAQLQGGRFASIAEEDGISKPLRGMGLSRSNSAARRPQKVGMLSRSNSVSGKDREPGESLVDRMKDMEIQRDALHQSLTRLLCRQARHEREYQKHTGVLELELARAQEVSSQRKLGYEMEVRSLREEVNHLRSRAQDALDQKWQCEKGLAGLKMDLDRAEQETTSLRVLLQEHDISVSEKADDNRDGFAEVLATLSTLESAYAQLQADRKSAEASIARLPQDGLASELAASVSRTDSLASNVHHQLRANGMLRDRLADAIGKGEREQRVSAMRINELQSRLKELEDSLLLAQQQSEEEMVKHEEDIRQLQESDTTQLIRMKNGSRSPAGLSSQVPGRIFGDRSPRLDKTTSGYGIPLANAVHVEVLERQVRELEKLLRGADLEMKEVVGRMNRAQIEVGELQADRDEALRQTRKLQAEIQAERDTFRALIS